MPSHRSCLRYWILPSLAAVVLLSAGCCGPMACGPVGCNAPIILGGAPHCGDGCDGCGERYVDEWINHPPRCDDPCEGCGSLNGQSCHVCRPLFRGFPSIWGYRRTPLSSGCDRIPVQPGCGLERDCSCEPACGFEPACGCEPACGLEPACGWEPGCGFEPCGRGCPSCASSGSSAFQPRVLSHQEIELSGPSFSEPVPLHPHHDAPHSPTLVRPMPSVKEYQPQRTRQIFRPRGAVAGGSARPQPY